MPIRRTSIIRLAFTALLFLATVSGRLRAAESAPALDIGVRSAVDERWNGFHKGGAIEHGKLYAIVAIKESPSAEKLVKPVNEGRMVQLLREELNARGFTEIIAGQKPEVLLTVLYGRGWLRNPYLKGGILDEDNDIVPVTTILMPDQLLRQREPGYESKLQAAQKEKLFIRVSAWKTPDTPEEKPANLWRTTMVLDDPANRDLNQVTREMLAAGAGYFDRQVKEGEVVVNSAAPQGRVKLGPLEILEPAPKGK